MDNIKNNQLHMIADFEGDITEADYLGVDRSAMCSELSRMQREGLLTYHKNHFSVHEALE